MRVPVLLAVLLVAAPASAEDAAGPDATRPSRVVAPAAAPPAALQRSRPRFRAEPFLIDAHFLAGLEPHGGSCAPNESATCRVAAFTVGGALLWRGIVGPSLGLWASSGAPIVPVNTATDTALGDRVSATLSLGVRPLAYFAWKSGDGWLSRFVSGLGLEVGPSLEYMRTSSIPVVGCAIPPSKFAPAFHGAAFFEVPVLGDAQSGWLSLRVMGRLIAGAETQLAANEACRALVVMPAVNGQIVFGVSYSL